VNLKAVRPSHKIRRASLNQLINMCDISHILQSSALLWTLALIPSNILPYLAVGVMSGSVMIYALGHNFPSARLNRIDDVITILEELLTHAKAKCMRNYLGLAETETRFLRYVIPVAGSGSSNLTEF
jgi:hypothetical protein